MHKTNGIFCLEGLWNNNIKRHSSINPILVLLTLNENVKNIYHDCGTKEELEFFIKKWKTKSVKKEFPILYLAFHGSEGCLKINERVKCSLTELATMMGSECEGTIVLFGSCSTLGFDSRKIQTFLKRTNCFAALGYKEDVFWMESTAFELLILDALKEANFDTKGKNKLEQEIKVKTGNLRKKHGFRLVFNHDHFVRKRK